MSLRQLKLLRINIDHWLLWDQIKFGHYFPRLEHDRLGLLCTQLTFVIAVTYSFSWKISSYLLNLSARIVISLLHMPLSCDIAEWVKHCLLLLFSQLWRLMLVNYLLECPHFSDRIFGLSLLSEGSRLLLIFFYDYFIIVITSLDLWNILCLLFAITFTAALNIKFFVFYLVLCILLISNVILKCYLSRVRFIHHWVSWTHRFYIVVRR